MFVSPYLDNGSTVSVQAIIAQEQDSPTSFQAAYCRYAGHMARFVWPSSGFLVAFLKAESLAPVCSNMGFLHWTWQQLLLVQLAVEEWWIGRLIDGTTSTWSCGHGLSVSTFCSMLVLFAWWGLTGLAVKKSMAGLFWVWLQLGQFGVRPCRITLGSAC